MDLGLVDDPRLSRFDLYPLTTIPEPVDIPVVVGVNFPPFAEDLVILRRWRHLEHGRDRLRGFEAEGAADGEVERLGVAVADVSTLVQRVRVRLWWPTVLVSPSTWWSQALNTTEPTPYTAFLMLQVRNGGSTPLRMGAGVPGVILFAVEPVYRPHSIRNGVLSVGEPTSDVG